MSTMTKKPWTADELVRLPEGWRYEIDEGELVIMAPAGIDHSDHTNWIAHLLTGFVHEHRLGKILSGEPGVVFGDDPQTLRGIDVVYFSNERLARITNRRGFSDVPPDLAVEVHDASEPDLRRKIDQYLTGGVRSVWVVDPDARTLTQHRPGEPPLVIADSDAVVEEPVLPGFACSLRELFGEE